MSLILLHPAAAQQQPGKGETAAYIEEKLVLHAKDVNSVTLADCMLIVHKHNQREGKLVTDETVYRVDMAALRNVEGTTNNLMLDSTSDINVVSILRTREKKKIREKKEVSQIRQLVLEMKSATFSERLEKAISHMGGLCRAAYIKDDLFSR